MELFLNVAIHRTSRFTQRYVVKKPATVDYIKLFLFVEPEVI